jgi:CheY-like chemotaxis protein
MSPLKVLVVDDEAVMRDLFAQVLEIKGHQVFKADTGQKAVDMVRRNDYDIVFLDFMMPDMNGVETLKLLKKMKPNIAVVMMTGFATEEKLREAILLDASDFLAKPFDIVEVVQMIEKLRKKVPSKKPE